MYRVVSRGMVLLTKFFDRWFCEQVDDVPRGTCVALRTRGSPSPNNATTPARSELCRALNVSHGHNVLGHQHKVTDFPRQLVHRNPRWNIQYCNLNCPQKWIFVPVFRTAFSTCTAHCVKAFSEPWNNHPLTSYSFRDATLCEEASFTMTSVSSENSRTKFPFLHGRDRTSVGTGWLQLKNLQRRSDLR